MSEQKKQGETGIIAVITQGKLKGCGPSERQISHLREIEGFMTGTAITLSAKKKNFEKKRNKIRKLEEDLNVNNDKSTIRRLTKLNEELAVRYNATLEIILADYGEGKELSEKLDMIAVTQGRRQLPEYR